jgi:alkaline phosphatase D
MNADYRRLRESVGVVGVWDDHDYGLDDGDSSNPIRIEQKLMFLDYLDAPNDDPRRLRGDQEGIHFYQVIQKGGFRVLLVAFDVRYQRTPE